MQVISKAAAMICSFWLPWYVICCCDSRGAE